VYNLTFSSQITPQFAIDVSGIYNFTQHDRKIQDINPADPLTGIRPNANFGRVDQQQSTGSMEYRALYVRLEKRFSHRTQLLASYTYAHSDDNEPLVRYIDPFNPHDDWGPADGERHHTFVASGSVLFALRIHVGNGLVVGVPASMESRGRTGLEQ